MIGSIWLYVLPVVAFLIAVWVLKFILGGVMTAAKLAAAVVVLVFLLTVAGVEVAEPWKGVVGNVTEVGAR